MVYGMAQFLSLETPPKRLSFPYWIKESLFSLVQASWLVMGQQLESAVESQQQSAVDELSAEELQGRLDTMYNQVC